MTIHVNSVKTRTRPYVGETMSGKREMVIFSNRPNHLSHPHFVKVTGPFQSIHAAKLFTGNITFKTCAQVRTHLQHLRERQASAKGMTESHPS
jgi:hypothetical protein